MIWVAALGGFVTLLSPQLIEHLQKWESGKARVLVVYEDKLAGNIPTQTHRRLCRWPSYR